MSARAEIANLARAAAVDAVWRQWTALGAPLSGAMPSSAIDPEALILLTCALRDGERRLDDVLAWWAGAGATLLSVQRVRTLARAFPANVGVGLSAFARAASGNGDARWKPLATGAGEDSLVSRGKRGRDPRLAVYPALLLRMRAAFGVGVKADVLSVLIASGGADATVRELVRSTGYTAAAIRRAAQEMEVARIVRVTSARPASYHADAAGWAAFLSMDPPTHTGWMHFADVFSFLAAVIEWSEVEGEDGYVAASAARDIFEAHRIVFELDRIPFTDPRDVAGARYLDAFGETVRSAATWLATNV